MKRNVLVAIVFGLALTCAATASHAATMYKWVDEDGTVHYGIKPPQGVEAVAVTEDRLTTVPVPESAKSRQAAEAAADGQASGAPEEAPKSIAQQRREERAAARAEAKAQKELTDAQCQAMRQQLSWVEPNPRVIIQDADGTTRRMDDDERIGLVNEAKSFIENNCE